MDKHADTKKKYFKNVYMKKIFLTCIIFIIVSNILLLYKFIETKNILKETTEKCMSLSIKEEKSSYILKQNMPYQQFIEGIILPDLLISSFNNKDLPSTKNKPQLFFRFKETHCDACIQSNLSLLKRISSQLINMDIVILSNYSNIRQLSAFTKAQKCEITVYNIESIPWKIDEIEQPYFFVLNENKRVNNVFIPIKGDNSYTEEYINCLLERYQNNEHPNSKL